MRLFSFVSAFFSTSLWRNPWSPSVCSTNINSARALFLAAEVTRVFFSSTLFSAHTFLILILQTASYTHACWLTLISGGCGVLRSTRVLHTKLNRPGTRSNRLGPDPDPADLLKYRPEPVRVLGPRVSGPPWRPLPCALSSFKKSDGGSKKARDRAGFCFVVYLQSLFNDRSTHLSIIPLARWWMNPALWLVEVLFHCCCLI